MTARLLTIMGSGETAPTMVKVHRAVAAAAGTGPPGILLDTPFGFQMNADELAARSVTYFADSVGVPLDVAGARTAADLTGPDGDAIIARLAAAPFVFSGPGSPTYALHNWRDTLVPALLQEKLALGGAVTFSSAAALTLGAFTIPVYEIYKVGEPPRWETGLDLLRFVHHDLRAAVVPHYDNAEGGTHDTRFCYLGEQRLQILQAELPGDAFVLGVDEHTAMTFDLVARDMTIAGLGTVTVRVGTRSEVLTSGTRISVEDLLRTVDRLRHLLLSPPGPASDGTIATDSTGPDTASPDAVGPDTRRADREGARRGSADTSHQAGTSGDLDREDTGDGESGFHPSPAAGGPLLQAARTQEQRFRQAVLSGDAPGMVGAVLDLEAELWSWRSDPTQSDEQDRARATLRAMIGELGSVAGIGTRDPAEIVGPYVDLAVALRSEARAARRFDDADQLRQRLAALGVEIRDSPEGSSWVLQSESSEPSAPTRAAGSPR